MNSLNLFKFNLITSNPTPQHTWTISIKLCVKMQVFSLVKNNQILLRFPPHFLTNLHLCPYLLPPFHCPPDPTLSGRAKTLISPLIPSGPATPVRTPLFPPFSPSLDPTPGGLAPQPADHRGPCPLTHLPPVRSLP